MSPPQHTHPANVMNLTQSTLKASVAMMTYFQLRNGAFRSVVVTDDAARRVLFKQLCVVTFSSQESLDSCEHYAQRTLMAPLCVAVQPGPFVWKWVYIHLLLYSPLPPPPPPLLTQPTALCTSRLGKLETCGFV